MKFYIFVLLYIFQVKVWFQNRRMKWRHAEEAKKKKDEEDKKRIVQESKNANSEPQNEGEKSADGGGAAAADILDKSKDKSENVNREEQLGSDGEDMEGEIITVDGEDMEDSFEEDLEGMEEEEDSMDEEREREEEEQEEAKRLAELHLEKHEFRNSSLGIVVWCRNVLWMTDAYIKK